MPRFKIFILLLVFVGCKDEDNNNTNDGTFTYFVTIEGNSYTWSGGVPKPGLDGQCAYVVNGNAASISLAKGVSPYFDFSFFAIIPTGIGDFTIDKNSLTNNNLGIGGFLGQTELLSVSGNNIVKIKIDKIDSDINGYVTGSINGKMTIQNSSTLNLREVSVVGTFKACKMN